MKKSLFALFVGFFVITTACQSPQTNTTPSATAPDTQASANTSASASATTTSTDQNNLDVTFSKGKTLDTLKVLGSRVEEIKKIVKTTDGTDGNTNAMGTTIAENFTFTDVGKINSEPYKNWSLVTLEVGCDGPCPANIYRFAWNEQTNDLANISNYSYKADFELKGTAMEPLLKTIDSKSVIKSLDIPQTIKIPNTSLTLQLAEKDIASTDVKLGPVAFKDAALGNVYFDNEPSRSCVYTISADGSLQRYSYNAKLLDKADQLANTLTLTTGKTINLAENFKNYEGGCGMGQGCYYMVKDLNKDNMELVGSTGSGIKLYKMKTALTDASLKDVQADKHPGQEQILADEIFKSHMATNDGKDPKTLDAFINSNMILFWEDPLKDFTKNGRWGYIVDNNISSAAECGKPVIYLYPKQTTDVKVQVGIDRLTASIPAYGKTGWSVKAHPDGKIFNYADKKNYPYLFWEGIDEKASKQIPINNGFSIARQDVHTFLAESLGKLGLNETEKKDFLDFWESRILQNPEPYFFFSFLGTRDFNKIAPLNITPAPDTLTRVFMYYSPQMQQTKVTPQPLKSIPRKGFTVIEWGGTSNVPWKK